MQKTIRIHIGEETVGTGANKRTLPAVDATVSLTIDIEGLALRFGHRAVRSLSKRAIGCGGLVKVRVLRDPQ